MLVGMDAVGTLAVGQEHTTAPLTAAAGSFALAGGPAVFATDCDVASGAIAVAGQAVSFDPVEAAATGSFTLTGEASLWSYDILGGGGAIVAGTFSRRRWRALQDELAAERTAGQQARERKRRERHAAAVRQAALRQAELAVMRAGADAAHVQFIRGQDLAGALAAFAAAHDAAATLGQHSARINAATAHAHAQAALRDEDDAIALLLLAA